MGSTAAHINESEPFSRSDCKDLMEVEVCLSVFNVVSAEGKNCSSVNLSLSLMRFEFVSSKNPQTDT